MIAMASRSFSRGQPSPGCLGWLAEGFSGQGDKLGELFFRGEFSQGAGVGLYLIRMLMERMSGEVHFERAETGGFAAKFAFQVGNC